MKILPLVLFFGIAVHGLAQPTRDLKLDINVEKRVYVLAEDIPVQIALTNLSDRDIVVNGMYLTSSSVFELDVRDQNGGKRPFNGWTGNPSPTDLEAKGKRSELYNVSGWYGEYDRTTLTFNYLRVGNYTVQAIYHPFGGTDTLVSDLISFSVVEPPSRENENFDLLIQAHRTRWNKPEECERNLRMIVEDESSPYYQTALVSLIRLSTQTQNPNQAKSDFELLLRRSPNSLMSWMGIRTCTLNMTKPEKLAFFEGLEQRFKDTALEEMLQESIVILRRN